MAHSSHPIPPAGGGEGGEEGSAECVLDAQLCTGTVHVRDMKKGEKPILREMEEDFWKDGKDALDSR